MSGGIPELDDAQELVEQIEGEGAWHIKAIEIDTAEFKRGEIVLQLEHDTDAPIRDGEQEQ